MREWCACGAAIRTWSYQRALTWRATHKHPGDAPEPEPEMNGSHASVEHAGPRYFESESVYGQDAPIVQVKTGFTP